MACTGLFKTGFYYKRIFKLVEKEKPYKLVLQYKIPNKQLKYPYSYEQKTNKKVLYLNSPYECENYLSALKEGDYCFKCKGDILNCQNKSIFTSMFNSVE